MKPRRSRRSRKLEDAFGWPARGPVERILIPMFLRVLRDLRGCFLTSAFGQEQSRESRALSTIAQVRSSALSSSFDDSLAWAQRPFSPGRHGAHRTERLTRGWRRPHAGAPARGVHARHLSLVG